MTRRNLRALLLMLMAGSMLGACQLAAPSGPARSTAIAAPDQKGSLSEFPLAAGTTWVYSFTEYEPATTDPTQITTATFLFTETVADTQVRPPYFIAHVVHSERLVKADPDWVLTESSRPNESWYIVNGQQVFQSNQALDPANLQIDDLLLAFDFPLTIGKSWCPNSYVKGVKVQDCSAAGKRTVAGLENQSTPAGNFSGCYRLTEDFNSGGVTRWFCNGIGVVAEKYDHAGTRFGFQQTLVRYSRGSP